jgi:hypothetical protein
MFSQKSKNPKKSKAAATPLLDFLVFLDFPEKIFFLTTVE